MEVYSSPDGDKPIWGPFLVDVDNEGENLTDALNVARAVVAYFTESRRLSEDSLRIFFTGRKGFNIEVRPTAIHPRDTPRVQSERERLRLIGFLRRDLPTDSSTYSNQVSEAGTIIDKFHRYVRLADSLNCWLVPDGSEKAMRKLPLTVDELLEWSIEEILQTACVTVSAHK